MALIPTTMGDTSPVKTGAYNTPGFDVNNNGAAVFAKGGYYTPGISATPVSSNPTDVGAAKLNTGAQNNGSNTPVQPSTPTNTLTSAPAVADTNNTQDTINQRLIELNKTAQGNLTDTYNNSVNSANNSYDSNADALRTKQVSEDATQAALEFKLGRTATPYGVSETQNLDNLHAQQMSQLSSQRQDLLAKAGQAMNEGNVALAKELITQDQNMQDRQDKLTQEKFTNDIATTNQARQASQDKITNDRNAAQDEYNQTKKPINDIATEAAKNGADAKTVAAINSAKDVTSAINAAGGSLQTATGQLGDYLQYKRDAATNGQPTEDYATWKAADDAKQEQLKVKEAYGTAFASASAKAAVDAKTAKASGSDISSPVTSYVGATKGLVVNAPASIAPYVNFSNSGVKYADLSAFAGTPTEKNAAVQAAEAAGYKVITNKNSALDVQNIVDANAKLADIKNAFSGIGANSATERNLYQAALTTMAQKLQTDPNAAASGVYQDAALDILKAMSGTQGFRGGASIVEQVKSTFPQNTDTKAVIDKKISNMTSMLDDRETALVGKPSASDQLLIDNNNAKNIINNYASSNPQGAENVAKLYIPGATDASVLEYMKLHPETYRYELLK